MARNGERQDAGQRNARRLVRPGPLMVAAAILWAAANEPSGLTLSSTIVWLLGSLTIAILARAALALLQPLAKLGIALCCRACRDRRPKQGTIIELCHRQAAGGRRYGRGRGVGASR